MLNKQPRTLFNHTYLSSELTVTVVEPGSYRITELSGSDNRLLENGTDLRIVEV